MPRARKTNSAAPKTAGPNAPFNTQPQPVSTPRGLPYGENQQAAQAQGAEPMAGATPISSAPSADQSGIAENQAMMQAAQQYAAPQIPLAGPTANPNEPVTTGLASGPGGGPEMLNMPPPANQNDPVMHQLQALYKISGGNTDILKVIELRQNNPQSPQ